MLLINRYEESKTLETPDERKQQLDCGKTIKIRKSTTTTTIKWNHPNTKTNSYIVIGELCVLFFLTLFWIVGFCAWKAGRKSKWYRWCVFITGVFVLLCFVKLFIEPLNGAFLWLSDFVFFCVCAILRLDTFPRHLKWCEFQYRCKRIFSYDLFHTFSVCVFDLPE